MLATTHLLFSQLGRKTRSMAKRNLEIAGTYPLRAA